MVDYLEEFHNKRMQNPQELKKISEDFASRCLFSLAFFQPALKRLYNRGTPNPEFYRQAGKITFRSIGVEEVSKNFENWEYFLGRGFRCLFS